MEQPVFTPTQEFVSQCNMTRFLEFVATKSTEPLKSYEDLHIFSVAEPRRFWPLLAEFTGAVADSWDDEVLRHDGHMIDARWFPSSKLNYAATLLKFRDDTDALVFLSEEGSKRRMSRAELYDQVSQIMVLLRDRGVGKGDRVAGFLPNCPEANAAMLATVALGAVWSSCSPDFGIQGVVDRFGQIEPKVMFAANGYFYNGKRFNSLEKVAGFLPELPTVDAVFLCEPFGGIPHADDEDLPPKAEQLAIALGEISAGPIVFEPVDFDHPLFILFSSGTTGAPKCIVHGHGGALLQHLKEHQLHSDISTEDRVFFFTTCSWMMWNWLVSALGSGATLLLYDGSPFYPDQQVLLRYAAEEKCNLFGTSPKYLEALAKAEIRPRDTCDLSALNRIITTGSPLLPESYDYVAKAFPKDVRVIAESW